MNYLTCCHIGDRQAHDKNIIRASQQRSVVSKHHHKECIAQESNNSYNSHAHSQGNVRFNVRVAALSLVVWDNTSVVVHLLLIRDAAVKPRK